MTSERLSLNELNTDLRMITALVESGAGKLRRMPIE
jgi:hypothetical protein